MTIDTSNLSELAKLTLVACDQSYKGTGLPVGSALTFLDDTPHYVDRDTGLQPRPPFGSSFLSDAGEYKVASVVEDAQTGLKAVVYRDGIRKQTIVAFAGVDGPNFKDWSETSQLGWAQWLAGRDLIFSTLDAIRSSDDRIDFTGQSLGAALAQYATYEFITSRQLTEPELRGRVSLTTFNGLGGIDGLVQYGLVDESTISGDFHGGKGALFTGLANVAHFAVQNDLVSRLGGGHLGGHQYELSFVADAINPRTNQPFLLDPVTAHRIESGFYLPFIKEAKATASPQFFSAARPVVLTPLTTFDQSTNNVIQPTLMQTIALINDKKVSSELEARYKLYGGLILAIDKLPANGDLDFFASQLLASFNSSGNLPDDAYFYLQKNGIKNLKQFAADNRALAGKYLLTALVLQKVNPSGNPTDVDIQAVRDVIAQANANAISPHLNGAVYSSSLSKQADLSLLYRVVGGAELMNLSNSRHVQLLKTLNINQAAIDRIVQTAFTSSNPGRDTDLTAIDVIKGAFLNGTSEGRKSFISAIAEYSRFKAKDWIETVKNTLARGFGAMGSAELNQAEIMNDFWSGFGKSISNTSNERLNEDADALGALDKTSTFLEFNDYVVALNQSLQNETIAENREGLKNAIELANQAGERPVLKVFASKPTNPFHNASFDPDTDPAASGEITNSGAGTYVLFVPYEAGSSGQRVKIELAGSGADKLTVLSDGVVVPVINGSFTLTIAEGRNQVAFALEAANDLGAPGSVSISATLVDAEGVATHQTHLEANVTLAHEDQTFDKVFDAASAADFRSADRISGYFSDGGTQNDPTLIRTRLVGTGAGDLFFGDHASESIVGGAGNDFVLEGPGSGAGTYTDGDAIEAGDGNDVVSGHLGARISAGDGDDFVNPNDSIRLGASRLDAGHQGALSEFPGAIYADLASFVRVRSAGDGPAFNSLIGALDFTYTRDFGDNYIGTPITGVSAKMGVVSVGSGTEIQRTSTGGAAFQFTAFNGIANIKYLGASTPLTYGIAFETSGDLHNTQEVQIDGGAGNDLLFGAGGQDFIQGGVGNDRIAGFAEDDTLEGEDGNDQIIAGGGDDYVDGGTGDDKLWGEGGNDGLWGGAGNDVIFGDANTTPVVLQGDDYLDGGSGDDQLTGNGGNDELFGGDGIDVVDGGAGNDYLDGEAGNDTLLAGAGDDELFGGEDNDLLSAGDGVDYLDGEAGNDQLDGGAGNDTLYGGEGTDNLAGGLDDDTLDGEAGSDQLAGGAGNDSLYGGDGSDKLQGGEGNDSLAGGAGDNLLLGDAGDDNYVLGLGDGLSIIDDQLGANRVVYGDGILADDVVAAYTDPVFGSQDLVLTYGGASRTSIRGGGTAIASLQFGDGTTLSLFQFLATNLAPHYESRSNVLIGTAGNDSLTDTSGMDVIAYALEGSDTVTTGAGNDVLYGGPGNDSLSAGSGNDTYRFFSGDGEDRITDLGSTAGNGDSIVYAADILPSQVQVSRTGDDLVLTKSGTTDRVTVTSYFQNDGATPNSVEEIEFLSDGTVWDIDTVKLKAITGTAANDVLTGYASNDVISGLAGNDVLIGNGGNDTLDGGPGVDTLAGGAGNDTLTSGETLFGGTGDDTYVFSRGSGSVRIDEEHISFPGSGFDTVLVSADIAPSEVQLRRITSQNLELRLADGSALVVDRQFNTDGTLAEPIEQIQFALDGTIWDLATIRQIIETATAGDDFLWGTSGDDVFEGLAGNDVLHGDLGSDTYRFNLGDGNDNIFERGELSSPVVNRLIFGEGITPADVTPWRNVSFGFGHLTLAVDSGDSVRIDGYFNLRMQEIRFEDGTVWTDETIAAFLPLFGTEGSDVISGFVVSDVIFAGGGHDRVTASLGKDVVYGGDGSDTISSLDGNDRFYGEAGNDTLTTVVGFGLPGTNIFDGGPGNDVLRGAEGDDTLIGGGDDDSLDGRAGVDLLAGGSGNDTYLFGSGYGFDTIEDVDITPGNLDRITMAAGITAGQVVGSHTATHRILALNAQDQLFIRWDPAGGLQVEEVRFSDGTIWDVATLLERTATEVVTNHPPSIANSLPDQTAEEDAAFTFTVPANSFSDPDGDTLAYSATSLDGSPLPAWLYFDSTVAAFSGVPTQADVGMLSIRVTASDASGLSAEDAFTLTIAPTNDAPLISNPIADQTAAEDAPFTLALPAGTFADVDPGDTLTYSAGRGDGSALPVWLSFDPATLAFSGTPGNDDVGAFDVRLTATDTAGATVSDVFALVVLNTNDVPTIAQAVADQAATEDQVFSLALPARMFADIDVGDTLTLSAALMDGGALPGWLSFNAFTQSFSGTPANDDVGVIEIRVMATDTAGSTASDTFALQVLNVNDAPVVAQELADQSVEAGSLFAFTVPSGTFVDVDVGDSFAFSATAFSGDALPGWLTFSAASGKFSGTPQASDIGISGVVVRATDAIGASASSDFALTVRALAGSSVAGGSGDDVLAGGTGSETLSGGSGNDALFGDVGDDVMRGGTGNDVLQGGSGADVLRAGTGQNLLDGGAGDDVIFDGAGDSFISGGAGNDTIRTGTGDDVIGFNRGDGWDTLFGGGDGGNTLSFGGGIRYSDLSFSKSGDDLIVRTGEEEGMVFKDWYAGNQSVLNLQLILDATEEFDAGSSDPLYNRRVQSFSFLGLVGAFDEARMASPGLTSWTLTNALMQFHLSGSDDAALGGDLAYWYARNRSLAGISLQAAQQMIGAPGFGSDAQTLRPFSGLQEGFVKLA